MINRNKGVVLRERLKMKYFKWTVFSFCLLFGAMLIVPTMITISTEEEQSINLSDDIVPSSEPIVSKATIHVKVYRMEKQVVEEIPLEDYIVGVVAGEMPLEFEEEALKAQALATRTYIVNKLAKPNTSNLPDGAIVTDTVTHQVYKDSAQLKEMFGTRYEEAMTKIKGVVQATEGQIITYNNQPIEASYFSTSNGYTENSEDIWLHPFPYLTSVASTWDEQSPRFLTEKELTVTEFEKLLGVKLSGNSVGTVLERTDSNRIARIKVGNKEFEGKEIRELLDLRSTDFTWERRGEKIYITTKGYGHGVGMSQYGAHYMAQEGKTYTDIIKHYYSGVEISHAKNYVAYK